MPARKGFRRFNQVETEEIRRQVDKMLKAEVIAACYSPYAAGVVLALRKDGTYRFARDLRRLNDITENDGTDSWAMPRINKVPRKCAGKDWFSTLDGRSAFWSVPLAEGCRKYTAFTTPVGLTVATRATWQEHGASLGRFLDRLIHHGFTLNLEKSSFLKTRVKLLGHTVSREGISATSDYVKKVADFTNFATIKDVQAYLGLSSFYRSDIRHFSRRTCNMHNSIEVAKLAKRTTLEDAWTPACEAERLDICTALRSAVDGPLAYPNCDRAFRCMTPGASG